MAGDDYFGVGQDGLCVSCSYERLWLSLGLRCSMPVLVMCVLIPGLVLVLMLCVRLC
jgi:hypothetical protein